MAQAPDSLSFCHNAPRPAEYIAPAVLIGSGLGVHCFAHNTLDLTIHDKVQQIRGDARDVPFDDYIQYLPVAMDLSLGWMGAKARHNGLERLVEAAMGYTFALCLSQPFKFLFGTLRPNGADYKSFPSGHTTFTFTGAELVRREYAPGWGVGAYGIAVTVGATRIWRNWHWFSDVLAGAGLGILSASCASWLLPTVSDWLGLDGHSLPDNMAILPSADPYSGLCTLNFSLSF